MNLNKYTKQELINKIKNTNKEKSQNSLLAQIKSYFSQIINLFQVLKHLILKLTLISLIINLFKNYRLFRKI
jgi:hypothetical protein